MRALTRLVSSGVTLVLVGCATGAGSAAAPGSSAKTNPNLITTTEIEAGTFRDAYDVVQRLRPTWFTKANSSGGTLRGTQVGGGGGTQTLSRNDLVVYLDNTRMGGVTALRDISASSIRSLEYMDAALATARLPGLGSSVIAGAIVATSRTGH
jgi:hypothetical protein